MLAYLVNAILNRHGTRFTKSSIHFNHSMAQTNKFPFLDISLNILNDLPTFTLYDLPSSDYSHSVDCKILNLKTLTIM